MNNTRKDFLKGMTGLASILACHKAPAFVRSMISARNGMCLPETSSDTYSAKDYVQNGLIAFWDAEWNVGDGEHEESPMVWKDLSGNGLDMISNGSPIFYSNFIAPTQLSEMFHTDETDLCDGMLQNATLSMEVVGLAVVGYQGPKFCLFGGGPTGSGFNVTAACPDPTRVGFDVRVGSVNPVNYGTQNPFAKFAVYADGTTVTGRYISTSGELTRSASAVAPITNYVSKRFAVGYRYNYYPDGPMVNGERVYSIRVYDHALTDDEKLQNDALDIVRFRF